MRLKSVQGIKMDTIPGFGRKWRVGKIGTASNGEEKVDDRLGYVEKYPG